MSINENNNEKIYTREDLDKRFTELVAEVIGRGY